MTDVQQVEQEQELVIDVPITKAKTSMKVRCGQDHLPEHVYHEALRQGLKVLLNRGQTKITKAEYPNPTELQAASLEAAEKTLEAMYAGKIRIIGAAKEGKVSGVVMTEARRIARNMVKQEIKNAGERISMYEASEITKAANSLIAADPSIIKMAEEEVDKRAAMKAKGFDVKSLAISQKKVKAAEAKRAEKALSAAKIGQVVTRGRPTVRPQ